ncbi:MAG: hypothetical protein U0Y82_01655 [Thermoleophilia bacterium]
MRRRTLGFIGLAAVSAATPALMAGAGAGQASTPMTVHTGAKVTVSVPTVVTGNTVQADVTVRGLHLRCDLAGTGDRAGTGHYHTILDGSLVDMECAHRVGISLQNVTPGKHTLTVVPTDNSHAEDPSAAKSVTFTYRPAHPLPALTARTTAAKPGITIVSPKPGTTVKGAFTLRVRVTNFTLSGNLFGKADVDGYGHWHANLDTTTGPMMGMGTMLGMSGTRTFRVSLAGVKPGAHRFYAVLVDNKHAPTPGAMASVRVSVAAR